MTKANAVAARKTKIRRGQKFLFQFQVKFTNTRVPHAHTVGTRNNQKKKSERFSQYMIELELAFSGHIFLIGKRRKWTQIIIQYFAAVSEKRVCAEYHIVVDRRWLCE